MPIDNGGHWKDKAAELLVATILHVLYAEDNKTLAGCASFLSAPTRSLADTLELMLKTKHTVDSAGAACVHPLVAETASELKEKTPNERSGILSTTLRFLALYRDPIVTQVTSASDWHVRDLMEADRPVSLYLACPPSDLSRTKPLMRLILNQIGRGLTERLPENGGRKLLLMLDEFPALGRLEFFESALAFMAGYGIRAYLIAQSLNQIEKAYGPSNSILDNCHVRVAFATNDERTAKRISDALGTKTELRAQKNYTGHRLAPWLSHMMVSRQETQRALMTPGEVMQLPPDEAIIMVAGMAPVRARKLRYFEDGNFVPRVMPSAKVLLSAEPSSTPVSRVQSRVGSANETADAGVADHNDIELTHSKQGTRQNEILEQDLTEVEAETPHDSEKEQEREDLDKALMLDHLENNSMPGY